MITRRYTHLLCLLHAEVIDAAFAFVSMLTCFQPLMSPHGHRVCARLSTIAASVVSIAVSMLADPLCTGLLSIPINACLVCYCFAGGRA